ncbi:hypothetical protein KAU88_02335 [Candidatus Bathyarchaeota archaeon]|nr:hypothetical protein [Candidatus Bathyarchaeota archaeon]
MLNEELPFVFTVYDIRQKIGVYDLSTIYDISKLRRTEKRQFIEAFNQAIMNLVVNQTEEKRKWRFVIFEESQLVFPEGSFRGDRYSASVELASMGRNYKVRFCCITPFSANVDKMLIKIAQQRWFGWTSERNDLAYLKGFIDEQASQLQKLSAGEFLYHFPQKRILKKIHIEPHTRTVELKRLTVPKTSTRASGRS